MNQTKTIVLQKDGQSQPKKNLPFYKPVNSHKGITSQKIILIEVPIFSAGNSDEIIIILAQEGDRETISKFVNPDAPVRIRDFILDETKTMSGIIPEFQK